MGLALKFAGIAIEAFIVSSLLSQAYQLISAKSDTAVMLGFLLLVLTLAGAISSAFFWFPGLTRIFDKDE